MAERITWFRIRIVLLALSAASGGVSFLLYDSSPILDMPPLLIIATIAALPFIPLGIAMVVSLQARNPCSDKVWTRPSHHSNPFAFGNPLPFFHFANYQILAFGAGMLATSIVGGLSSLVHGGLVCLSCFMGLLGVRLAMRWCRDKMEPVEQDSPGSLRRADESGASEGGEQ